MVEYELKPTTQQRSFYKKAFVKEDNGIATLYSYNTPVATIKNGKLIRLWSGWSATTSKHVDAFCDYYNLNKVNKKKWMEMPLGEEKVGNSIDYYKNHIGYRTCYY